MHNIMEFNITNITVIITFTLALCSLSKELFYLVKNSLGKNYVEGTRLHSIHHIIMIVLLLLFGIGLNIATVYHAHHGYLTIVYNVLLVPIIVRHFEMERLSMEKETMNKTN